jgi:NAD-dependent deacetylase
MPGSLNTPMSTPLQQAAAILAASRSTVALTGAGISVESGIPPFRGKGGLWEKIDPVQYGHIDAYRRDPAAVWRVLFLQMKAVLDHAQPNPAHAGLHRLEQMGLVQTIITQNIDGLHQLAGSQDVVEFHGSFATLSCTSCGRILSAREVDVEVLPPQCVCGGTLRPDVVMFGEIIAEDVLQRARMLATSCDAMLVIGTSATVQPAAHLPMIAKNNGAAIVEINAGSTPLTDTVSDVTLLGPAGRVMQELVAAVELLWKQPK